MSKPSHSHWGKGRQVLFNIEERTQMLIIEEYLLLKAPSYFGSSWITTRRAEVFSPNFFTDMKIF